MALTQAQNTTLKIHIEASTDPIVVQALEGGAHSVIAIQYNLQASPNYFCWRSRMSVEEIRGLLDWDEVASQNMQALLSFQILTATELLDPSNSSIRQAFASIFNGASGLNSRTALLNAAKRTVTLGEKVLSLSSGAGSSGNPDSFGFEGDLGHQDITLALING